MARTPNERRVAAALETLEAGTPLYESVLGLASAEQASGAFRQLAGEIYPATQAALMRESRLLREAVITQQQRVGMGTDRESGFSRWGMGHGAGPAAATGSMATAAASPALGGRRRRQPDADAARGAGVGLRTQPGARPGNERLVRCGQLSPGRLCELAAGRLGLLLGTAHSWHDGKVKRSVAYEGASDELKGRFSGDTQQFFAETSYRRFLGETTVFEPYAGLAYVSQHTHRKRESGGGAALEDRGGRTHAALSTLGLRGQTGLDMGRAGQLKLSAGLGWQHVLTGATQQARLGFVAGGRPFASRPPRWSAIAP